MSKSTHLKAVSRTVRLVYFSAPGPLPLNGCGVNMLTLLLKTTTHKQKPAKKTNHKLGQNIW